MIDDCSGDLEAMREKYLKEFPFTEYRKAHSKWHKVTMGDIYDPLLRSTREEVVEKWIKENCHDFVSIREVRESMIFVVKDESAIPGLFPEYHPEYIHVDNIRGWRDSTGEDLKSCLINIHFTEYCFRSEAEKTMFVLTLCDQVKMKA